MNKEIISLIACAILFSGCQLSRKETKVKEMIPYLPLGTTVTVSPTPEITISLTPEVSPSTTLSAEVSAVGGNELFKVGNIYGCRLTDKADFTLDREHTVTKINTWYTWQTNETEVGYEILSGTKIIASGKLFRDSCDPYQTQWCSAVTKDFNKLLQKGEYVLKLESARLCQNSQSDGKGFITVYGE